MSATAQKWLLRAAPWFLPVGIVLVWQLASSTGWLSSRILPSPEGVVEAFWSLSVSGELWQHLAISSWRGVGGFPPRGPRRPPPPGAGCRRGPPAAPPDPPSAGPLPGRWAPPRGATRRS